jgi:hypothetical protein
MPAWANHGGRPIANCSRLDGGDSYSSRKCSDKSQFYASDTGTGYQRSAQSLSKRSSLFCRRREHTGYSQQRMRRNRGQRCTSCCLSFRVWRRRVLSDYHMLLDVDACLMCKGSDTFDYPESFWLGLA